MRAVRALPTITNFYHGGVCISEYAASAQGPNLTSPTIFHFIYKSKLLLLQVAILVAIVVILANFGEMCSDFSV